MKTTGGRAGILYLMILGFFAGLGVFLYGFVLDGGSWAMQPFNKYASGNSQLTTAGDVLDRKGVVLAKSENGKRVYSSDETIRRSMLHAVGDTNGSITLKTLNELCTILHCPIGEIVEFIEPTEE